MGHCANAPLDGTVTYEQTDRLCCLVFLFFMRCTEQGNGLFLREKLEDYVRVLFHNVMQDRDRIECSGVLPK